MRRICTASVSLLLLLPVFWFLLHDYQRRRILTFIAGGSDPLGADYNILQSQIAIGSGGLFGKGFLQGTQTHLHFLPEYRTDFIFALIGEEFGFIGCCVVVVLFLMLVGCIFQVSIKCKNVFLKLYCHGIAVSIFLQAFINIAMVMGALPVVGVPLPMVSYGGTTLLSTMFSIALVLTAYNNRKRAPT